MRHFDEAIYRRVRLPATVKGGHTLGTLCQRIFTGKTAPRREYTETGLHMVKVGNLTGRGIEFNAVERQFVSQDFHAKHPGATLQKGDILLTAAAHGPKWIGLKVDIFTGAPKHIEPTVMVCGELMVLRLRKDASVDPYTLLLFLRSAAGYQAIQNCIRGQSGHLYADDVKSIHIPDFDACEPKKLKRALALIKAALSAKRRVAAANHEAEALAEKLFPTERVKPIIAL